MLVASESALGYWPAHTGDSLGGDQLSLDMRRDLACLFGAVHEANGRPVCYDIMKHLYSSITPDGCMRSGAEIGEILFSGGDPSYTGFWHEAQLIERNERILSRLVKPSAVYISLGCGPHAPVLQKDIPTARMIKAGAFVAADINARQASNAASQVSDRIKEVMSCPLVCDFTRPFLLPRMAQTSAVFMTMFGCTLGQFIDDPTHEGERSLGHLLANLYNVTEGKAILLATVDENKHPSVISSYTGDVQRKFMLQLWHTAAYVLQNKSFNPGAFAYTPRYDGDRSSVVHQFVLTENVSVDMGERKFSLPAGQVIVVGYSQKRSPLDLRSTIESAGWVYHDLDFTHNSTSRFVLISADKTPAEWAPEVNGRKSSRKRGGYRLPDDLQRTGAVARSKRPLRGRGADVASGQLASART